MAKTTAKIEWKHPMVVDAPALRKLDNLLLEEVGAPTYKASCKSEIEIEFTTVEELIGYENHRNSKIETLAIYARSEDWEKEARISIKNNEFGTLSAEVTGTLQTAPRYRDEIASILEGLKAWYWPFSRVDFFLILIFLLAMFLLGSIAYKVIETGSFVWESIESNKSSNGIILLLFSMFAIAFLLNRIRAVLFPRMVFLIGQETKRHNTLSMIQWGVVISFMVSIIAGMTLNKIF